MMIRLFLGFNTVARGGGEDHGSGELWLKDARGIVESNRSDAWGFEIAIRDGDSSASRPYKREKGAAILSGMDRYGRLHISPSASRSCLPFLEWTPSRHPAPGDFEKV